MEEIGGYFELELNRGKEFHENAHALNLGRNALELILRIKKYKKVYIPFYTCEVILEPLIKTNTFFEYYNLNQDLEPIFSKKMNSDEAFLYTNYFGIKDSFIKKFKYQMKNLIVDNSQAFFSEPEKNINTFYSCRKFFGVPDGAYLYIDELSNLQFPLDRSENRFSHLIRRIEQDATAGYEAFKNNEEFFIGQPILHMSKITKAFMKNIDYKSCMKRRNENFLILYNNLKDYNELKFSPENQIVPMIFPFLYNNSKLKQELINDRIYIATYWPCVLNLVGKNDFEYYLTKNMIPLPIDHRYTKKTMEFISKKIISKIE